MNIIDKFFEAYSTKDLNKIQQVLSENIKWVFPGQNLLSGIKVGIEEVISFLIKWEDSWEELMLKLKSW